jgi:hypothetical protein
LAAGVGSAAVVILTSSAGGATASVTVTEGCGSKRSFASSISGPRELQADDILGRILEIAAGPGCVLYLEPHRWPHWRHPRPRAARQAPAPAGKTAVDRFDPEGEYRAGARRHALKPLNLLAKDGRWLNRSTHALVKRFQSGIVPDLFQSEGKSQMAGPVPEELAALQQCRSPCEHEGNRGV